MSIEINKSKTVRNKTIVANNATTNMSLTFTILKNFSCMNTYKYV